MVFALLWKVITAQGQGGVSDIVLDICKRMQSWPAPHRLCSRPTASLLAFRGLWVRGSAPLVFGLSLAPNWPQIGCRKFRVLTTPKSVEVEWGVLKTLDIVNDALSSRHSPSHSWQRPPHCFSFLSQGQHTFSPSDSNASTSAGCQTISNIIFKDTQKAKWRNYP